MQLEQCTLLPNTNARGATISNMQRGSVTECCTECQETDGCNVFVYCPKDGGWCVGRHAGLDSCKGTE